MLYELQITEKQYGDNTKVKAGAFSKGRPFDCFRRWLIDLGSPFDAHTDIARQRLILRNECGKFKKLIFEDRMPNFRASTLIRGHAKTAISSSPISVPDPSIMVRNSVGALGIVSNAERESVCPLGFTLGFFNHPRQSAEPI